MTKWVYIVGGFAEITDALYDREIDVPEAGRQVIAIFEKAKQDAPFINLMALDEALVEFEAVETEADWEGALETLYDWADDAKVWIEPLAVSS